MYPYYNVENLKPEEVLYYLRKSRSDDPLLSVEEVLSKHETLLDEWAEKNLSGPVPAENRYKEVVSGESLADRIEFQKVLKRIESPAIKAVLVVEIARLGRPDLEEIGKISKIFRYTDTMVITTMRAFNLKDEYDRDLLERELKRGNEYLEYTKKILSRGRDLSARSGNYIGTTPPFGYDKITVMDGKRKCPTLAINEEQADIVRMMFHAYVHENIGTQAISNRLNEMGITAPRGGYWKPEAIRDILENPHYLGMVRWNARKAVLVVDDGQFRKTRPKNSGEDVIFVEGRHEAIISEELFQAAQEKRGRSHRTCSNRKLRNPLASILFCECGKAMAYRHSTRGDLKYRDPRLVCNDQHFCKNGACSVSELMEMIEKILAQKIKEFQFELEQGKDQSDDIHEKLIKTLEKKLADIGARELSLWESQVDPDMSSRMPSHIFEALTGKLAKEREETEQALAKARSTVTTRANYETLIVNFQKALDALRDDNVSVVEKNRLLKACIKRVTYHRDPPQRLRGKGVGRQWILAPVKIDVQLVV